MTDLYAPRRRELVLAPGVARLKGITMMAAVATPPVVMQGPPLAGGGGSPVVPFRRATVERVNILPSESGALSAQYQPIERTTEGTGYIYRLRLRMVAVAAGNAATVAFGEDGPQNALGLVTYSDPNGQLVNVPNGWYLYLGALCNKQYSTRYLDQSTLSSAVTGAGATGGSFTQFWDIPIGINRRSLLGIVGNQDRAIKYSLRTDINPLSVIYGTAPTAAPTFTLEKYYEYYSVPLATGPNNTRQQSLPSGYGTLHFTTVTTSSSPPVGGSTVNHYLTRVGNTIRYIALVFRLNGGRAAVETAANTPTLITFKGGDDTIFTETWAYRKSLMFERYGFDFPPGVLVYDTMHDFGNDAGSEIGDDYYHTQALVNGQFQVSYPAGFGSTNNSLTILTDDLVYASPTG